MKFLYTGEFRQVEPREYYLGSDGQVRRREDSTWFPPENHVIVKPLPDDCLIVSRDEYEMLCGAKESVL